MCFGCVSVSFCACVCLSVSGCLFVCLSVCQSVLPVSGHGKEAGDLHLAVFVILGSCRRSMVGVLTLMLTLTLAGGAWSWWECCCGPGRHAAGQGGGALPGEPAALADHQGTSRAHELNFTSLCVCVGRQWYVADR